MSGDIIDFEQRKKAMRTVIKKDQEDEDILEPCPECGDTLFMIAKMPNVSDDNDDDPYGVFCQHCTEPVGYFYFFPPDDEE